MSSPSQSEELAAARARFEHYFGSIRRDLKNELGVSWRSTGLGVMLLAAAVGFGLAGRWSARRADGVNREDA